MRRLTESFNESGIGSEETLSFFDAAAVFEEPPEQPALRTAHGREEIARVFGEFDSAWEDHQSRTDEIRVIADERCWCLSAKHFRSRDGIEINQPAGGIFTLRGGKIVRMQSLWERATALEAAGLTD